jgi:predicted nucleic acid-binding Zn ribbon protein
VVRRCEQCGKRISGRADRRYCDAACRRAAHRERQRAARAALVVELPVSTYAIHEQTLVQGIAQAAAENWRAAAWLLERRWPERWGTSRKPPTASDDVDELDPFREVDELARRRREQADV